MAERQRSGVRYNLRATVPVGVEKVLCLAAADPGFKAALLADPAGAVGRARLGLEPAETALLAGLPPGRLAAMVEAIDLDRHGQKRLMRDVRGALVAAAAVSAVVGSCITCGGTAPDYGDTEPEAAAGEVVPPPGDATPAGTGDQ
jgi:hypothetical protein